MIIKDDSSCHTLLNKSLRFSLILRSSQGVLTLLMSQRDLLRKNICHCCCFVCHCPKCTEMELFVDSLSLCFTVILDFCVKSSWLTHVLRVD